MEYRIAKKVVETATWAASSDKQIDLPNEGAITRIDLHTYFTVTGVLAADTNIPYGLWRPIQNLKIQGGGGKSYFDMSYEQMGRMLHFLNRRDFPGRSFNLKMATNTQYANYCLHFGSRPRDMFGRDNPFDLTAFIPAQDEVNLKLTWTTTQAADIADTAIDISAGTMIATVYEVLGLPSMSGMVPVSSTEGVPTGGTAKSGLSKQLDVPTGSFLRRIAILTQDHTAVGNSSGPILADDIVDEVGLLFPKESRRLIEIDYDTLLLSGGIPDVASMTAAGAVTKPSNFTVPGFVVIDLRAYANSDYGLDLRNYQTGDVKLAFTIPAGTDGDDIIVWYDTVQPYVGRK